MVALLQKKMYGENTWPYPIDSINQPILNNKFLFIINNTNVVNNVFDNIEENCNLEMISLNFYDENNNPILFEYSGGKYIDVDGTIKKINVSIDLIHAYIKKDPSTTWIVEHRLDKDSVDIDVYDENFEKMNGVWQYSVNKLTNNICEIVFNSGRIGYAITK